MADRRIRYQPGTGPSQRFRQPTDDRNPYDRDPHRPSEAPSADFDPRQPAPSAGFDPRDSEPDHGPYDPRDETPQYDPRDRPTPPDLICRAGGGRTNPPRSGFAPSNGADSGPPPEARDYSAGAEYFAQWAESWSSATPDLSVRTPEFTGTRQFAVTPDFAPRWWTIAAYGRSIAESAGSPPSPVGPASSSALASAPQISRARLRINWHNASGGAMRDITIGGGVEVSIFGRGITASILAPPNAVWGPNSLSTAPSFAAGVAVTESVAVSILPGVAPVAAARASLVDVVVLPVAATATVAVPSGARYLTMSQTGAGALADANFVFLNTDGALTRVIMDATQRTIRIAVPVYADSVYITGTQNDLISLVWELDV